MACTCECTCPLSVGDQIRHKLRESTFSDKPIRTNALCPSWLKYLSDEWAVVQYYSERGPLKERQALSEKVFNRRDFDDLFERDPRREEEPVDAPRVYPLNKDLEF